MKAQAGSARVVKLEADLRAAAAALISVIQRIEPERWAHVPGSSIWSVGKDAAHVAEAAAYHQLDRPPYDRTEGVLAAAS